MNEGRLQVHVCARPHIQAPPVAAAVVIANLLRNALQYSGDAPVDVELNATTLVARDQGIGLGAASPAQLRRRGVRGGSGASEGSGLGLSLVDRLCQRFGWCCELESRSAGGARVSWHFRGI